MSGVRPEPACTRGPRERGARADQLATERALRGIVIASPEGLRGGGGIGSVTRLIHGWMQSHLPLTRVHVIDPRGDGSAAMSIVHLALATLRLVWLRASERPEILHLQVSERLSFFRKGVLLGVGRALGMRTVLHHHGAEVIPFYRGTRPVVRRYVRWVARTAHVNVVLGEVWRRFLSDELGVPPERIQIHLNAAEDVRLSGRRTSNDPWKLLLIANLSPRKGVGELLEAVAQLAREGAPVTLTLAGGGQVDGYRDEALRLGIDKLCTFTGWLSGRAVHDLFLSHGTLVLPSHHEGLPMTILEALSAELPVVTTRVGSIPEVLDDARTCLFVDAGSVDGLVSALKRLAALPSLGRTLAIEGRRLYDARFATGSYMSSLTALYVGLLHGPSSEAPDP